MSDKFTFDVFLSHSSKDKSIVRAIAERLRADGLRVWLDAWEIRPGDSIPAKIEEGLERSRVLVLCMSAHAFGSDWARLEAGTFRFRDPLNSERRFIPLRLDEATIRGSLAQFLYISWLAEEREQEYTKLVEACRPPAARLATQEEVNRFQYEALVWAYVFSPDGKRALSGGNDDTVRLWDVETGRSLRLFEGHTAQVTSVAWSSDQRRALSGSLDETVLLWDVEAGQCMRVLEGHRGTVHGLAWSADQRLALSGSADHTVRLWDLDTGRCRRVFEGHTSGVRTVAWSADQRLALSGSDDVTVRLWDVETGRSLRVFEGHTAPVTSVAWSADQRLALSGSDDHTVRLWDLATGQCLCLLEGHTSRVRTVSWSADQRHAYSGDEGGSIRVRDLSESVGLRPEGLAPDQVQYTNAKVLLVGDSSAGKTGLSMRLALNDWKPSDSTVGAWATRWKLPVSSTDGVEREIWLWDFGGQADQRLIHQLYMEDAALVVLVFDGQREDLFETLGQWDRDLTRASRRPFTKVLAAGRVDAGGLRVSRNEIDKFVRQRGFDCFLETSAKADTGCRELKEALLAGIRWAEIPWRSSPRLFKRLKEEIIRLKDEGRVLMRSNELRDALRLRLAGNDASFKDEELKAVVGLLAGPGVVWELSFGSWVLLQPERINAYAQAVIQTLRADEDERGSIAEERVLKGDLAYQSSMKRLEAEEERFVLLAMHQTLVERGLCLRVQTDMGPLLVFPSYYRRERPELVGHPAVLVSYRFTGFLDDIYATLVVRLHHTEPFQRHQLWRYAADFKTNTGKLLGLKLARRAEGVGELEVYFDPAITVEEKIIFSRYIHEHLLQKAQDIVRLRHYVCPHCGTPVGNREVAMRRLDAWLENEARDRAVSPRLEDSWGGAETPTIICSECEKRVPLWDELEHCFASPEVQQRVQELRQQSAIVLANESKERALVGEVISTVALAGQISREFKVSDHGIDMEVEFRDDAGEPTGKRLYLQLKSGDSYNSTDISYWKAQPVPVLLMLRAANGEVRWMEVSEWEKLAAGSREHLKRFVFQGARFDVMTVRLLRDKALSQGLS